ncbi:MAG: DNA-directed RNA polymerase subunit omega [Clostridium sp.]|nr:MAG: DNA-directed RNA polymerase subunit omega [Clostridium sp.]
MKKVVYDGMRYPSIDDLLNVIDSKYKLAICAAKRAKIIEEEKLDIS